MARWAKTSRDGCWCSPRTRGDGPNCIGSTGAPSTVLPAHAGMARRGPTGTARTAEFSPHTRGWPGRARSDRQGARRSPRTRGDGPAKDAQEARAIGGSPRTRGDGPRDRVARARERKVLPAHAGMARSRRCISFGAFSFSPHTRGWPAGGDRVTDLQARSPRTRGDGPAANYGQTYRVNGSSRTRGDGPAAARRRLSISRFSLHTRGWPEWPRYIGKAPDYSPRTRGDGPDIARQLTQTLASSTRPTRGWPLSTGRSSPAAPPAPPSWPGPWAWCHSKKPRPLGRGFGRRDGLRPGLVPRQPTQREPGQTAGVRSVPFPGSL